MMKHLLSLLLSILLPGSSASHSSYQTKIVHPAAGVRAFVQESPGSDIRDLKQGQPIEQELAGDGSHAYRITAARDQYISVVVEPKGIDVLVRLFGVEGQMIAEVDDAPASEKESICVVSEAPGGYRLEVRPQNKSAAAGRYEIGIEEWRPATPRDRDRFAAQGACSEAHQLRVRRTAESLTKAIQKYQQALPLWRAVEDRAREANTLNEIGAVYSALGDTQNALHYYSQAIPLFTAIGDLRREAITLNNIGVVYSNKGDPEKALEYFSRALELKRLVGNRKSEANSLYSIASVYSQLGELQKSLDYYDQALALTRVTGERIGESLTLNSIGSVYFKMGEWQKALEYHTQGLTLARVIGDRRSEAVALHNVGTVLFQLGEMQKALEYYEQALSLRRALGDRYGEAYTLDSMGSAYFALDESKRALDYHNQALAISQSVGDKYGEAYVLSHVGTVKARLGAVQEAMDYFNKALSVSQAVGDRRGEAFSLRNIGSAYSKLNESQKAKEHYDRALAFYRAVGDRNSEAGVLLDTARVDRDRKRLNEARALAEESLVIVESERRKVGSQDLRASYMTTKRGLYEFYVDVLMQLHREQPAAGYDAIALEASERARARGLLDMLTEARADIRQGVDPLLLDRERKLQQELSIKSERLTRLLSGKHTGEQESAAKKDVKDLLESTQIVEAEIRAKSPRYAALTQPQLLSLGEIQQQVLDPDTMLLEYMLGEERSYLWAVTTTSIKSFELPRRAEIEAAARRVYELMVSKADALYPEALTNLSRMVLGPVMDQLGRRRLLIVSDGSLQYIPFGALPVLNARQGASDRDVSRSQHHMSLPPLILNHEIVNLPSASVLALLRHDLGGRKPAPKTLAVLADPVFEKKDRRVRSTIKRRDDDAKNGSGRAADRSVQPSDVERSTRDLGLNSFERLVLSRREAELITALASRGKSLRALDFTASRATATSPQLEQYQIVHFATHSLLNNQHPELSGIVLSLVDRQGEPQDGFLRLYEVYNLRLAADLVVLSACQTALGKEVKGEGLVGLTRGFMYAGTPRVVASLWKVADKATAELMRRFYQRMLRDGLRPAAALRAAQVSMMKERQWQAAYYWAGFVLQGEWR